jgi:YidC/Oxa1 family membrane protein insertase
MPILANIIQSLFSLPTSWFESILVFRHGHVVGGSWGLAIVGLTVIVRALLVPLALRQLRSMHKMQMLAPRLKEIKDQYKDDRQRQHQEIMVVYRENKIHPLGAFGPLIAQAPVFVSLYYALRKNLKLDICGKQLKHYFHVARPSEIPPGKLQSIGCNHVARHSARFLFLGDITAPTTGLALVVLIVLYLASQMASVLVTSATTAAPGSKMMMLALPFVLVFFVYTFPPGVLVYWITTNFWTAGQNYLIKRHIGVPPTTQIFTAGTAGEGGVPAGPGDTTSNRPATRKKRKRSGRRR